MSRISLGITLSIVAIALAVAGMVSFFMPVSGVWAVTDRASMVLHFFDGRVRVFWITSPRERITVIDRSDRGPNLWVHRTSRRSGFHEGGLAAMAERHLFSIRIGARNAVPAFGGQWRSGAVIPRRFAGTIEVSFVRMPFWLPVILLLVQPIQAIVFGPWRRRWRQNRNLCLTCGYERIGLTEPRCPECGTPHP